MKVSAVRLTSEDLVTSAPTWFPMNVVRVAATSVSVVAPCDP